MHQRLTILLVLLAGCEGTLGPEADGGAATAPDLEVTRADFCDELVEVLCASEARCCMTAQPERSCAEEQASACAERVGPLLDDPRLGYAPDRGAAYLNRLRADAQACFVEPPRRSDLLGIFEGTGELGADCTPPTLDASDLRVAAASCRDGLACRLYRATSGGVIGACEAREDDACSHRFDCSAGTWCDFADAWEPGRWGTCRPLRADGWECGEDAECGSGDCGNDGFCATPAEGRWCTGVDYPQTVLRDRPAGYWRLSPGATDATGRGWAGRMVGAPASVDGAVQSVADGALEIDEVGEGVTLSAVESRMSSTSFTLEAWVRRDAGSGPGPILDIGEGAGPTGVRLWLHAGPDQLYAVVPATDGEGHTLNTPEGTVDGEGWHHVALTYDGEAARLFLDGDAVGDPLEMQIDPRTQGELRVGHRPEEERHITGAIDEVAIYPRALSRAALARHASRGRDGPARAAHALFGWLR